MKKNIKTNFTAGDIIKYAKYLNGLTSEKIETHNLPGESKRTSSGWYYVCDLDGTKELMINSFGYPGENLTNVININDDGTNKVPASDNTHKEEDKEPVKEEIDQEEDEPKAENVKEHKEEEETIPNDNQTLTESEEETIIPSEEAEDEAIILD